MKGINSDQIFVWINAGGQRLRINHKLETVFEHFSQTVPFAIARLPNKTTESSIYLNRWQICFEFDTFLAIPWSANIRAKRSIW